MENNDYLIDEIIRITEDAKSINFWKKAIKELGSGIVNEELHELKYQMHLRNIVNPAKYLTSLLKKQMCQQELHTPSNFKQEKLKTYFEATQLELFQNLQPIKPKGKVEQKKMAIPYGKNNIPWATFIGPFFFTLSTNKAKSDKVLAKFRTLDGQVTIIPMIRGRITPGGKERGILNVQHARILAAIKNLWAKQGSLFNSYPNGVKTCHCFVPARELSKFLGWKKFGGKDLIWLIDKVYDLKVFPYYLYLSELGFENIKGYGFTLLKSVTIIDGKKHGQYETVFEIEFSVPLSTQLLDRHSVTKSKEILIVYSEIATLLQLYLEPILISLDNQTFRKQLKDIIIDLQLPKTNWHNYPSMRKRVFEKVIKELNKQHIADGRKMSIWIEKGLYDYMITAKLVE